MKRFIIAAGFLLAAEAGKLRRRSQEPRGAEAAQIFIREEHAWEAYKFQVMNYEISETFAQTRVRSSCGRIAQSIVHDVASSHGTVDAYMQAACKDFQNDDDTKACQSFVAGIHDYMVEEDPAEKDPGFSKFCNKFYEASVFPSSTDHEAKANLAEAARSENVKALEAFESVVDQTTPAPAHQSESSVMPIVQAVKAATAISGHFAVQHSEPSTDGDDNDVSSEAKKAPTLKIAKVNASTADNVSSDAFLSSKNSSKLKAVKQARKAQTMTAKSSNSEAVSGGMVKLEDDEPTESDDDAAPAADSDATAVDSKVVNSTAVNSTPAEAEAESKEATPAVKATETPAVKATETPAVKEATAVKEAPVEKLAVKAAMAAKDAKIAELEKELAAAKAAKADVGSSVPAESSTAKAARVVTEVVSVSGQKFDDSKMGAAMDSLDSARDFGAAVKAFDKEDGPTPWTRPLLNKEKLKDVNATKEVSDAFAKQADLEAANTKDAQSLDAILAKTDAEEEKAEAEEARADKKEETKAEAKARIRAAVLAKDAEAEAEAKLQAQARNRVAEMMR
eukprot:gnl/TRDRNA2_/TRDRNA2_166264_c2_seq2.p1 gnl/TRDRNA2_/TRDRNA2_166264_c2~~gnl/TRDRNA2_/TRDRNA2_166264_c2_seq2.p1  ORF type:complete len:565 (+),score=189.10 gnl/TRDRNA2_/TRDRNA2_166264_c2_seq2:76-1770(+)